MEEIAKNFVGGEWVEGARVAEDINPSDTDDVVGRFVQADAKQAEAARGSLRLSMTNTAPGGHSSTALRCGWLRSWNTLNGLRSSRAGM